MAVCAAGWVLLAVGFVLPLGGVVAAALDRNQVATALVGVPDPVSLLIRSLTLSGVATVGALTLGLFPAAVLGSARGRTSAILIGLVLAPLLVPPQVYAYAWQLLLAPQALGGRLMPDVGWLREAVKAGLISAGWLWPVAALILAAGLRSTGQAVFAMALLDASPWRAFSRAVVPSLRPYLMAAASLIFAITLIEFPIPHLSLARVYSTELQVLVDVGAPPGQVVSMAAQVSALVGVLALLVAWSLRDVRHWQALDEEALAPGRERAGPMIQSSRALQPSIHAVQLPGGAEYRVAKTAGGFGRGWWVVSGVVWLATLGLPVSAMIHELRPPVLWGQGFQLLAREWIISLGVAAGAGAIAVVVAVSTALLIPAAQRGWKQASLRGGAALTLIAAMIPAAALGIGFVVVYNRAMFSILPGGFDLYADTPVIWVLAMGARYAAIAVLVVWLAVGRRSNLLADSARVEGADAFALVAYILAPMLWPSLLAAGLLVSALALFEVVAAPMVAPVTVPSGIAKTILNHMHYGRDNVVITTSLTVMVAGILLTQVCGWLLVRGGERGSAGGGVRK
jgi:iron(III) transport system permease protein